MDPATDTLIDDVTALANRAIADNRLRPAQLEMWPEAFRAQPNESARSALFTVRRGPRRYVEDESLVVLGDGELKYRGQELRTDDEDVWLQILHVARLKNLEEWVEFSPYTILKALDWPTNGTYYKRLKTHLTRMQATALQFNSKRLAQTVSVSLIRRFEFESEGKPLEKWRVWIEREMRQLFGSHYYTQVEWELRKTLTPIAKRLMDYFGSHKEPLPVKLDKLREMCGSETEAGWKWKQVVTRSLKDLVDAGFLSTFDIDRHGRVCVKRA